MPFGELLREKQDAIVGSWLARELAAYGEEASKAFSREKDPFANPVGHNLRVTTREIFEALLEETGDDEIREKLLEIVRIRAVQQFTPSQAVGFVFSLKEVARTELGKALKDPGHLDEMVRFERQIDRVALVAFDIFVECREQMSELRINEVKRSVSWVMKKMNQHQVNESPHDNGQREGVR